MRPERELVLNLIKLFKNMEDVFLENLALSSYL